MSSFCFGEFVVKRFHWYNFSPRQFTLLSLLGSSYWCRFLLLLNVMRPFNFIVAAYQLNLHPPYSVHLPSPLFVAMSRLDQTLDELAKSMRPPRRSVGAHTRGGVRAAGEAVGDRVSAETGSRPKEGIARTRGKGRRREGGKGKGSNSGRVSANRARDPSKASDPPNRRKSVWRPRGASGENRDPHGARGHPEEGNRTKGGVGE